ncbi:MAG: choice-of-anchor Q domain-containing protein, partial [Phycisphaerales bacterium]|nr:choice-of-anchor Q domain-containing protein [Phycisphaerales bacterium]
MANNTITSNAAMKGGAISCASGAPTIVNDIAAFNSSGIEKDAASTVVLRDNCVYGNTVYNYSGWSTDPTGTDGNISADPRLAGSAYSNLHIQPDSPCVDAGDDSVVGPDWLDMDGQPRIQGDHVDIGADESDGTVWTVNARIVRVSLDGGDSNDGSAWNLAKRTVQAGIDAASTSGGEVWVKAGKYDERITLRTFAYVYGGFSGNETQRLERNWRANVTVLDGGGSGSVVTSTDPGYLLSCVDGFTIRGGDASVGGGVYCNFSSPGIANNVITENHASSTGAGVYCYSSSAMISNNTITANNAVSRGGGIYGYSFAPTIVNNTVAGNNGSSGGGMGFLSSNPVVSNNIIAFNSSGIYKSLGSVTLNSNCVYGNTAYNYSGPAPGVGDISVDPLLVDGTGGDYHIARVSPCIDSGYDTGAPGFDADGMIRPQDGNGDGTAICDIGAYEYPLNLGAAKRTYPDGHPVALGGVSVTAVFAADGRIYVERTDRTSGVRVDTTETFSIGQVVNLSGALQTDPIAGERYALASPPWPQ